MQKTNPGKFDKIKLITLPTLGQMSVGTDGLPKRKLANTDDNMALWMKEYGDKLIAENSGKKINIMCIANEAQREFKDQIAKKYLPAQHFNVTTISKSVGDVAIDFTLDSLTRLLFVKREAWLKKKATAGAPAPVLVQHNLGAAGVTAAAAGGAVAAVIPAPANLVASANKINN